MFCRSNRLSKFQGIARIGRHALLRTQKTNCNLTLYAEHVTTLE
jgi:hypothetical protein